MKATANSLVQRKLQRFEKSSSIGLPGSWLYLYLRNSTPPRISEALAPLTLVIETCKRINGPDAIDVVPTLFLAVCLSRIAGEEEAALQTFKQAFLKIRPDIPPLNIIWARANKTRLLRQMYRTVEAELEEKFTRQWIIRNQSKLKPSLVRSSLSDDVDTGAYILDHPDVVSLSRKWKRTILQNPLRPQVYSRKKLLPYNRFFQYCMCTPLARSYPVYQI